MAFSRKLIDLQFNLGKNISTGAQKAFDEGGTQLYVRGLRVSASIVKAGGLSMGSASVAAYGMTLSQMNQLSTLGINPLVIGPNFVTVMPYDEGSQPSVVFQGSITNAWMDGNAMPEVAFRLEAHAGLFEAIAPCPPSSYQGPVAAADVFASLAAQMGMSLENSGVTTQLPAGMYFSGSARSQAYACAKAANVNILIDSGKLAVWPKGKARGSSIPLVSPSTGLRGYPSYTSKGVELQTLFNPAIGFGANIQVESSLKPACGTWNVYSLDHQLDSQVPGGSWFTTVRAAPLGGSVTTPGVQTAVP
jgi:hypothetical protein